VGNSAEGIEGAKIICRPLLHNVTFSSLLFVGGGDINPPSGCLNLVDF